MRESTTAMNLMTASDSPTPNDSSGSGGGGSGKKVRKPYTITKSRESWTDEEHDKFIEAIQLFDRDWNKIEDFVGSKSVIQIRSHAQKYFLKVQKSGTVAHVPPPRPKRKAAHPYPQKAPRNVLAPLQASMAYPSSINSVVPGYPSWDDAPMVANAPSAGAQDEYSLHGAAQVEYSMHGAEGQPDFAEVYSFIGSMFDPDSQGHQQKLKEMNPVNFETVLLLMRNLTINLSNPDSWPIKKALSSSYDTDSKTVEAASVNAVNTDNYDLTC